MICICGKKMKCVDSGNIERHTFKHLTGVLEEGLTYRKYKCSFCNTVVYTEERRVVLKSAKTMKSDLKCTEMRRLIGEYGSKAVGVFSAIFDCPTTTSRYWHNKAMKEIREKRRCDNETN